MATHTAQVGSEALRPNEIACFGPFRLTASERLLTKGDEPVAVGGRALDILVMLVERAGEVVTRRELIDRVWPDIIVEEANLRVHLAGLRKLLGEGKDGARYITNVPGRGYCFVSPVRRSWPDSGGAQATAPATAATAAPKLPAPLARMIGRQAAVATLRTLLTTHRFVNIVAPGGMGKTTVAVAVAHAMLHEFDDAAYFVDLGAVTDGALVASAVAAAVGCFVRTADPVPGLLAFLVDKRALLILDSCEHVIEAVAALTERLFSEAPHVHLLATSRELLRVEGENVYLLHPLETPMDDGELTAAQALDWPAVQLFMERAAASGYRVELSDADASTAVSICRRLDGIALAIELAASRVGAYGLRGTAELLGNRFGLLWQGRRTALPRHQTLQAMLDWSYNLLSPREQTILCRLSVFVGHFTLEAALAVAGDTPADAAQVANAIAGLVDKSLVWNSAIDGATYHRLLDTTRAYAAIKLAEGGDPATVAQRHARHYADHLTRIALSAHGLGSAPEHSPHMGNIRAALEWSLSETGDSTIGVELAARSAPLFLAASLLAECERWCRRALTALPDDGDRHVELALQEALAISSMFTRGNGSDVLAGIQRGLDLAVALGDRRRQIHLHAGLNVFLTRIGAFREALDAAGTSVAIAAEIGDPGAVVIAEWMLGVVHHLIGNQQAAQFHCERGLELAATWDHIDVDFFGYDHRVRALVTLARALWLRGRPEQALHVTRQAIDEATRRDHPVTLCIAYIYAIPVYLWTGDLEGARAGITQLIAHGGKYSLGPYHAVGMALQGELAVQEGRTVAGVQLLRQALATLQAERHNILAPGFYRALAEGLARCGQFAEAEATIADAIGAAGDAQERFDLPDLLRTRGEILLSIPQPDLVAAEESLIGAVDLARERAAPGWELRAALPLARLWISKGRAREALDLLTGLLQHFREDYTMPDLEAARGLLHELHEHA
ncbi:MAG: winged helix-turn-helix domain-containing protein [Acetobacteraceae bacterium]